MVLERVLTMGWMAVFLLGLLLRSNQAISVNGNGYELTIAISEDAMNIAVEERQPFLDSLQVIFRQRKNVEKYVFPNFF